MALYKSVYYYYYYYFQYNHQSIPHYCPICRRRAERLTLAGADVVVAAVADVDASGVTEAPRDDLFLHHVDVLLVVVQCASARVVLALAAEARLSTAAAPAGRTRRRRSFVDVIVDGQSRPCDHQQHG